MKSFLFSLAVVALVAIPTLMVQADTQTCVNLQYNMGYGATDAITNGEVSALQDFLISASSIRGTMYLTGESTGYFGVLTQNAVANYQKDHYISPSSGYVGAYTRAEIKKNTCGTTATQSTVGLTATTTTAVVVSDSTYDFNINYTNRVSSSTDSANSGFYACGTGMTGNVFANVTWVSPGVYATTTAPTPAWYVKNGVYPYNLVNLTDTTGDKCVFIYLSTTTQALFNSKWEADFTLYNSDLNQHITVPMSKLGKVVYRTPATVSGPVLTSINPNKVVASSSALIIVRGQNFYAGSKVYLQDSETPPQEIVINPSSVSTYSGEQLSFVLPKTVASSTYTLFVRNGNLFSGTTTLTVTPASSTNSVNISSIVRYASSTNATSTGLYACGTGFGTRVNANIQWKNSAGLVQGSPIWYLQDTATASSTHAIWLYTPSTTSTMNGNQCTFLQMDSNTQALFNYGWSAYFTLFNYNTNQSTTVEVLENTTSSINYAYAPTRLTPVYTPPQVTSPVISALSPISSTTGATITVTGTDFGTTTNPWVLFGNGQANYTVGTRDVNSAGTSLKFTVPMAVIGKYQVQVKNNVVNKISNKKDFTIVNPASIITPVVSTKPLYPVCGTASGKSSDVLPSTNLCTKGLPGEKGSTNDNRWYWACVGENTTYNNNTIWCYAPKTVWSVCGTATTTVMTSVPNSNTSGLCTVLGTSKDYGSSGDGRYYWSCQGANAPTKWWCFSKQP